METLPQECKVEAGLHEASAGVPTSGTVADQMQMDNRAPEQAQEAKPSSPPRQQLVSTMAPKVEKMDCGTAADEEPENTNCPLSNLQALVVACEMAAEREGLSKTDHHYFEEVVAESPGSSNPSSRNATSCTQVLWTGGSPRKAPASLPGHQHSPAARPSAPIAIARTAPVAEHDGAHGDGAVAFALGPDGQPKYRRHKSKVFIRPNKVVYLPTTFMEENFDPDSLPLNCEMVVDADGTLVPGEKHHVTIKAVPRQGLSTMYCCTNVMKFQQQYLNWQILNWTKIDNHHIKIHLQSPHAAAAAATAEGEGSPAAVAAGSPKAAMAPPKQVLPAAAAAGGAQPRAWRAARSDSAQDFEEGGAVVKMVGGGEEAKAVAGLAGSGDDTLMPDSSSPNVRRMVRAIRGNSLESPRASLDLPQSTTGLTAQHAPTSPTAASHKRKSEFGGLAAAVAAAGQRPGGGPASWEAGRAPGSAPALLAAWQGRHPGHRAPEAPAANNHGLAVAGSPHGLYYVVSQQQQQQAQAQQQQQQQQAGEVHLIARHVAHHHHHPGSAGAHAGSMATSGSGTSTTMHWDRQAPALPPHTHVGSLAARAAQVQQAATDAAKTMVAAAEGARMSATQRPMQHQALRRAQYPSGSGSGTSAGTSSGSGRISMANQGGLLELDAPATTQRPSTGATSGHTTATGVNIPTPPHAAGGSALRHHATVHYGHAPPRPAPASSLPAIDQLDGLPGSAFKRYRSSNPTMAAPQQQQASGSSAAPATGIPNPMLCNPYTMLLPFLTSAAAAAAGAAAANATLPMGSQAASDAARSNANCLAASFMASPLHMLQMQAMTASAQQQQQHNLGALLRYMGLPQNMVAAHQQPMTAGGGMAHHGGAAMEAGAGNAAGTPNQHSPYR